MSEKIIIDNNQFVQNFIKDKDKSIDFYDRKMKALEIKSKEQDISMRKEYADIVVKFVVYYMAFVFIILFLSGTPSSFKMSYSVLMTLLGTTTATVISLFAIVVNYLFPKK